MDLILIGVELLMLSVILELKSMNKKLIFFGEYAGALGGEAAITPIGKLKKEVSKKAFTVRINLNLGASSHRMFTSDLSEEYVAFNRLEYALKFRDIDSLDLSSRLSLPRSIRALVLLIYDSSQRVLKRAYQ